MDITILNQSNIQEVIKFLNLIDSSFIIPLSNKIDIEYYVKKIIDKGVIFAYKDGERIVGIALCYINNFTDKRAYISCLGVSEDYKNKGIATKLINTIKRYCIQQGFETIYLNTHKDNYIAIKLYKKHGFNVVDNMDASHSENIVMSCELNYGKDINILLTSVGRRGYLVNYFKEALKGKGKVHVTNNTDISPAFCYADYSEVSPSIYENGYIEFLKSYCIDNNIKCIISLFDIDLPVLAKNKKVFEEIGTKVIVSDESVINICNDKWLTYKYLKENNYNVPRTYKSIDLAIKAIELGKISYPVIIKPRWGMGSISVYIADNQEELEVFYNKVRNSITETYLKYESEEKLNESILIQEKLIGKEYGLDIINDLNGNYQNTIVKEKYAMRSGETDCAITVKSEKLKSLGYKLSKQLKHISNLDTDVFIVDGQPYILEMNARFGGGYPFSHLAGVDLPGAIISWMENKKCNKDSLIEEYGVLGHKDISILRLPVNIGGVEGV